MSLRTLRATPPYRACGCISIVVCRRSMTRGRPPVKVEVGLFDRPMCHLAAESYSLRLKGYRMQFFLRAMLPLLSLLSACASMPAERIPTVPQVELPRFMGPWYVIASIPTFVEKDAFAAIESYALNPDGTIATTFTFHKGSLAGPLKTMRPRGFVHDNNNATWAMQFVWPLKAEYLIAYVDPEYSETIIARNRRDYVWIMARTPQLSFEHYQHLVDVVATLGYDLSKLKRVIQFAGATASP